MKENYTNFFSLLADFEKEANRLIKEDKEINWEPDRTIGWALEESVDTLMEHVADVSDFDWDIEPDGEGGEIPTNAPIEWTREDPNTTKKQVHFTLDENQRDNLCDILDRELNSWFEFYRDDSEAIVELENYTSFQLLKQMAWPLEDEIRMINEAKKKKEED